MLKFDQFCLLPTLAIAGPVAYQQGLELADDVFWTMMLSVRTLKLSIELNIGILLLMVLKFCL